MFATPEMRNHGHMRRHSWVLAVAVIAILLVLGYQQNHDAGGDDGPSGSTSTSLPKEAHETLALIEDGGPFPYARDGVVFMNRERLLPQHARGYWREYTVPTPGESDRGARRIVRGEAGELYYTDDHYASFMRIGPTEQEEGGR